MKWLPLVSPVVYLTRRMFFVLSVVYLPEHLWLQLMIQFYISTAMVIYLVWFSPLMDKSACQIEAFNEVSTIFLMYHLLSFSDFVPSVETRNYMGYSFIFFVCINIAVHLSGIARENYSKLK